MCRPLWCAELQLGLSGSLRCLPPAQTERVPPACPPPTRAERVPGGIATAGGGDDDDEAGRLGDGDVGAADGRAEDGSVAATGIFDGGREAASGV